MTEPVHVTVNGEPTELPGDADATLLSALRGDLDLLGSRFGCGMGLCGACFVLVDGHPTPSCDTPLWAVAGKDVVTVEGLSADGELHPVQQAILDEQAAQCGFCTSGIVVSAAALLARDPSPDEVAVIEALDRNLCRCGIQRRVVRAVLRAAESAQSGEGDETGGGDG